MVWPGDGRRHRRTARGQITAGGRDKWLDGIGWEDSVLQKDTSRRSRLLLPVVAVCAAGVLATACQSTSSSGSGGAGSGTSGTGSPAASGAQLSITPTTGS